MARHAWRVDKAPTKIGMRVLMLSDPSFQKKLRVYTASDANWLNVSVSGAIIL